MRVAVLALGSLLLIAGCSGPAEPDRSVPSSAAAASATAGVADAAAPFLTTDCAVAGPPTPSTTEPSGQQGIDGVFVATNAQGVPSITISDQAPDATKLETLDLSAGTGTAVTPGASLSVNYCGVGLTSRTLFDSSWTRGEPITFDLNGLIQGWIDGLPGMRVGGERLLIIPGALAYGPNPPPGIEPNETLVFVVQLLDVTEGTK